MQIVREDRDETLVAGDVVEVMFEMEGVTTTYDVCLVATAIGSEPYFVSLRDGIRVPRRAGMKVRRLDAELTVRPAEGWRLYDR